MSGDDRHARDTWPHVFRPLSIGPMDVRHRIMVTGHTQLYGERGLLSERHLDYYEERARGGAALLILEQQAAHPSGRNYHAGCEAWDERAIPWYEKLGRRVHAHDCRQLVQLFASGAQGSGTQYIDDWRPLWAASRIPSAITGEMPVAMEQTHIDELVAGFAASARNVEAAGLDGVEIHAAHSQLLGEFLSPAFNKRDDAYGGSLARRCRLVLEVGEAVRAATGSDFSLGLRLSIDEFLGAAGITADDTAAQLDLFAASGLFDFFDLSVGGYHTLHIAVAPMGTMPEGFLAEHAARARSVVGDRARLFLVGRFLDLDRAETVLADGHVDMVAMTRAHMADAHVVNKSAAGNTADVVRCIGANVCVARLIENREVTCVQNPAMGRERAWGEGRLSAVSEPRTIGVIGAGPAGLRLAGTAAARGHRVRVFERGSEAGGRINPLKQLPTRAAWQQAIDNLLRPLEKHGVTLETGCEVTQWPPDCDVLVAATGAAWMRSGYSAYRPERAGIPGADLPFVLDIAAAAGRAVSDPRSLGARVLIVDETGDYLPLGVAEVLAGAGVSVDFVTPRPMVGADTQRTLDMPHVMPRLTALGVRFHVLTFIERLVEGGAELYGIWGEPPRLVDGIDSVLLAMTREPDDALYHALAQANPARAGDLHRVGDVVAPRRLEAVIYDAERLAREL